MAVVIAVGPVLFGLVVSCRAWACVMAWFIACVLRPVVRSRSSIVRACAVVAHSCGLVASRACAAVLSVVSLLRCCVKSGAFVGGMTALLGRLWALYAYTGRAVVVVSCVVGCAKALSVRLSAMGLWSALSGPFFPATAV